MKPRLALLVASCAVAAAACGSAAATPAPSAPSAPASPVTAATIVARNIAYDQASLTLAPGAPIQLTFQNADAGIPHNLHISGSGQDVVKGDIVTGPASQTFAIGPLQPGGYDFVCDVHPNMKGTITVPTS